MTTTTSTKSTMISTLIWLSLILYVLSIITTTSEQCNCCVIVLTFAFPIGQQQQQQRRQHMSSTVSYQRRSTSSTDTVSTRTRDGGISCINLGRPKSSTFASIRLSSTNGDMNTRDDSIKPTTKPTATTTTSSSSSSSIIDIALEEQINQGLQRAKEVLEKSKAKLAARQQQQQQQVVQSTVGGSSGVQEGDNDTMGNGIVGSAPPVLPFFATTTTTSSIGLSTVGVDVGETTEGSTTTTRSGSKVKSRNSDTGLIMADGERMAELSEMESWEYRSIYELFPTTPDDDDQQQQQQQTVSSASVQPAPTTDVMASIYNLRKVLQAQDYRIIFDARNRFIGEDN